MLIKQWRDTRHPEHGGSEVYVERVAEGLAARGWRVTCLTATSAGLPAREDRGGVRYVRRGNRMTVYLWGLVLQLGRRLGRPDVTIDVQNGIPFASTLVTRRPVVTLVHHVHEAQWPLILRPAMARIGWWIESAVAPLLYRRCRYVTVSQRSREELVELGIDADRISIVHNGVDESLRLDRTPTKAVRPTLVVLGRLVPHKRVEHAIEVVAELAEEIAGLELWIVGRGYWRPHLEQFVAERDLTERVTFHGFVDEERRRQLLGEAWLQLIPSVQEGWSLVVMEAASQATPTVAYAAAGGVANAVVDGETGVLVDDLAAMTQATRRLLTSPDDLATLGRAAQRRAAGFTWHQTADDWDQLLRLATRELPERTRHGRADARPPGR